MKSLRRNVACAVVALIALVSSSCAKPAILVTRTELLERSQKPTKRVGVGKFAAAAALPDLLTGGALLAILNDMAAGLVRRVADLTNNLEQHLHEDVEAAIAQLQQLAEEDLKKPIEELTGTARLVVDRAALIAFQGMALMRSLETCTAADAKLLAGALDATLTGVVTDAAFWSGERSFVTAGYVLGTQSRMGIYAKRAPTTFKFSGYFQRYDPACGSPDITLIGAAPGGGDIPLRVLTADERSIVVEIPTLGQPGTFLIKIRLGKKKRLCNSCERSLDGDAPVAVENDVTAV